MKRVILDMDPGVDDALAILLALVQKVAFVGFSSSAYVAYREAIGGSGF